MCNNQEVIESDLDFKVLLQLSNEYYTCAQRILEKNSTKVLDKTQVEQFYSLINFSIKTYILILEKHNNSNSNATGAIKRHDNPLNFHLSLIEEIVITLKLLDLLLNYTRNYKLAKSICYKLIVKAEAQENNMDINKDAILTDYIYKLQFFYLYLIPSSSIANLPHNKYNLKEDNTLKHIDFFLKHMKHDEFAVNPTLKKWKLIFHLCKINYLIKILDAMPNELLVTKYNLSNDFESFKSLELKEDESDFQLLSYVKLCEIVYKLSIDSFDEVCYIFENDKVIYKVLTSEEIGNNVIIKVSFYLLLIYITLVQNESIVDILKEVSKIFSQHKELFQNSFQINIIAYDITIDCNILQYDVLKKLLIFSQGLSKIQVNYTKDMENYYMILMRKVFKNDAHFERNSPHRKVGNSLSSKLKLKKLDNKIKDYSKFYSQWQKKLLLNDSLFKLDYSLSENSHSLKFYQDYMSLLTGKLDLKTIEQFEYENRESLELYKYKDIRLFIELYKYALERISTDQNETTGRNVYSVINKEDSRETLENLNFPVENKIFEETKLLVEVILNYDLLLNDTSSTTSTIDSKKKEELLSQLTYCLDGEVQSEIQRGMARNPIRNHMMIRNQRSFNGLKLRSEKNKLNHIVYKTKKSPTRENQVFIIEIMLLITHSLLTDSSDESSMKLKLLFTELKNKGLIMKGPFLPKEEQQDIEDTGETDRMKDNGRALENRSDGIIPLDLYEYIMELKD